MNILQVLEPWLYQEGLGKITHSSPISGGSICDCFHITTESNKELFVKTHNAPPKGFFAAEATNLKAIAGTKTIYTPRVYHYADNFLALEYLPPGKQTEHYWKEFGRKLALMHQQKVPFFGFSEDNYCGLTPQPNQCVENGHIFFVEQRILHQAKLARENSLLPEDTYLSLQKLCNKIPELIPDQPASLIHGDLWHGNTYCLRHSTPALIDPACYWGWAEAEIAMTHLFGSFPDMFYQTYREQFIFEPDFNQRIPLYNLYHILNHLNLFGSNYLPTVTEIIKRYI